MLEEQPTIDPHHHLWDLGRNTYPWLQDRTLAPRLEGDIRPIARDYLLEDYASDTRNQNVVKSVHIECGWDPSDPVGETAWLQQPRGSARLPSRDRGPCDLGCAGR